MRCCRRQRDGGTPPRAPPPEPFLAPGSVCRCRNTKTRVRISSYYCRKRKNWDEGNRRGLQRDCCHCCWGGCLHGRSSFCPSIQACPSAPRRKALQIGPFPLPVLGQGESRQLPTQAAGGCALSRARSRLTRKPVGWASKGEPIWLWFDRYFSARNGLGIVYPSLQQGGGCTGPPQPLYFL